MPVLETEKPDVQLVYSRDGRTWCRLAERRPIIPTGPHDYDAGCILGVANQPVYADDHIWIYYTGITTTHGGCLPEKRITIARAAWRRDGFVSLDAGADGGIVQTMPLEADGRTLQINADATGGMLRVELVGANGQALPGYGVDDCYPIESDSVRHRVTWRERRQLPQDLPVSLRFHLRETSLYSYTLR